MATTNPIYIVTPKVVELKDGKPIDASLVPQRLVRAKNKAQAWRHIASGFNVTLASQNDLVEAVGDGVLVEEARDDSSDDETTT